MTFAEWWITVWKSDNEIAFMEPNMRALAERAWNAAIMQCLNEINGISYKERK